MNRLIKLHVAWILGFLTIILSSCLQYSDSSDSTKKSSYSGTQINDLIQVMEEDFYLVDSIELKIPDEIFPQVILDVCVSDSFVFLFYKADQYLLSQFAKNGHFLKVIKQGQGPGEIRSAPAKLAYQHGKLAVAYFGLNIIQIFHKDSLLIEQEIVPQSPSSQLLGIEWRNPEQLIVSFVTRQGLNLGIYSSSFQEITSINFSEIKTDIINTLPTVYSSLSKIKEDLYLTHVIYPPYIFAIYIEKDKIFVRDKLSLQLKNSHFRFVDQKKLVSQFRAGNIRLMDYLYSYSSLLWTLSDGNKVVGIFRTPDKHKRKLVHFLFKIEAGKYYEKKLYETEGFFKRKKSSGILGDLAMQTKSDYLTVVYFKGKDATIQTVLYQFKLR